MAIKKGDFVEMDFTGKIVENGQVFDTTLEDVAKENNIFQSQGRYQTIVLVVGELHVVKGLDEAMIGLGPGKHNIKVGHEDAFGKKVAKLLKIVPMKDFKKQNLKPFVGMEVNVDNLPGIIRTVSGGRVIVDFNHPLSSKDLEYDIDIKKVITDKKEQLEAILRMMGTPYDDLKLQEKKAKVIHSVKLPLDVTAQAAKEMSRLTGLSVEFVEKTSEKEEKQT